MVKLWLSREHPVSLREQLSAQLLLGIVSGRIRAGERLPSVRLLARKLQIHANTVSAVYRDLETRGLTTTRPGSGVYVRDVIRVHDGSDIETFVRAFLEEGVALGFAAGELEATLAKIVHQPQPARLLVVDPDEALARILACEMEEIVGSPIYSAALDTALQHPASGTWLLSLPAHAPRITEQFGSVPSRVISLRSMEEMLSGYERPPATALIAVVSRSPSILRWAVTLLSALGFPPPAVLERNPDEPDWERGLSSCHVVAADVEAARELPVGIDPVIIHLVSDAFLAQTAEWLSPHA